ncbi:MAG: hypothetical protein ACYS67_04360 [Planctomycetota bacterium]
MNRTWIILLFLLSISFPAYGQRILYVDPAGSNIDGTTWSRAFKHLQDALAIARKGDEIRVAKGIYKPDRGGIAAIGDRNASFRLVNGVVIKGGYRGIEAQLNPDIRNIALYASILSGDLDNNDILDVINNTDDNSYHVISGSNLDPTTVLDGFTIMGGDAFAAAVSNSGGGMYNVSSSPIISHCIFIGNFAEDAGGAMLNDSNSNPMLINCTFSGNWAANSGGGIHNSPDSKPRIINCIFWNNVTNISSNNISSQISGGNPIIRYSCLQGWTNGLGGGNIGDDPLFADPLRGDFHLRSQRGRFMVFNDGFGPAEELCVMDEQTSPCIDAGEPGIDFSSEPIPNGRRINMGAYGGTSQASASCWKMSSDGNRDLVVDVRDLKLIISHWLEALPWTGFQKHPPPPTTSPVIYHVDIINGSIVGNGRSRETAFNTIQQGIDAAQNNDTVLVWPGIYDLDYQLDFYGKAITVRSASDAAVLRAAYGYGIGVEFSSGEDSDSILANFVITDFDIGIYVINSGVKPSSPTITNVTVVDNMHGLYVDFSDPHSAPNVSNSIFWANSQSDMSCMENQCLVSYSCVEDGYKGQGNISQDPLFANPADDDYHLLSKQGRFWPNDAYPEYLRRLWVLDKRDSPCIDAGDPKINPGNELVTGGGRINMGAYGNTPFASRSQWLLRGDVDKNGRIDLTDYAAVTENWLKVAPWLHELEGAGYDTSTLYK